VLVVQQMARHELKEALSPGQMQALLRDHSMGTPVYRDNRVVGVLPDLAKLHAALRRLPRLHVRAFIGDSGEIPVAREKMSVDAQSPDIFVCARGHPHPDLKYGSPNASPDTVPTVDPIRPGTRSALYIRVRNQGDAPAENLRAAAYWAEHLHDPDEPALWHAVDETKCPPLPQGNGYVIVGPLDLELSKRVRPSTGKIDIIVAVGGDLDPRPNLPPAEGSKQVLSRNKLLPFLQSSANVAMRCVEVVSGKPA
jgi:hypothetical protein